ncbi:diguanylate cyclase [Kineococcus sp. T13]|uniref:GGDEF domain-containing protein n=1 Tax=Kineococcus vitellinus TaxID=2696565 RepID=UPI00141213EF|nr:GGDEF domain-containing protein [Kineococcus vitellinus]NAZ75135.1 diguanylate cyclase [Kineococcus vitellinus]
MSVRGARGARRLLEPLHRPSGLVPRTRWLFLVFAVLALLMSLPGPLAVANAATLPMVLGASAVLVASWVHAYRSGRESAVRDVADCVAITAFTLSCPAPAMVFSITFCSLWLHAVHGSTRRGLLRCAGYAAAVSAALPLWGLVPGHAPSTQAAPVFGTAPVMLLTFVVVRVLALGMFARERAAQRDALLVGFGTRLLGTTDGARIAELAVASSRALCASTPGLRSLAVQLHAGHAEVIGVAGAFESAPGHLPADVVPPGLRPGAVVPVAHADELDAAAGEACRWVCLDLPEVDGVSVLLGSPGRLEPEVVVSFQSLANQVALAASNARVHRLLSEQARTDALTGLANRAAFQDALTDAAGEGGERAVLFVDLDGFKAVNDRFGHAAGDELLRHVADRVREVTSPRDVCARLGGDEFALLLRGASAEDAAAVGRRVVDLVSAPVRLAAGTARVGASVGTAHAVGALDPRELLDRADAAMYAAKAAGKGRVEAFTGRASTGDGIPLAG